MKELEPYLLAVRIGLGEYTAKARMSGEGIHITNFTSPQYFLESLEQSGDVGEDDDARHKAVELFGETAVALFVLDYLVEHDDRHWGNLGWLRDTETGEYLRMSPYYDFDWAWSDGVVALPENALRKHGAIIRDLCEKALAVASEFEHSEVIRKRAKELLSLLG
jgi:hypothetical protein